MKDRIPTIPGRVLIHPENGEPEFYAVLSMADDPSQIGTDLNKLNLLSDQAVADLRMPSTPEPTVDLAFRKIARDKLDIVIGSYSGSGGSTRTVNLGFRPKAVVLFDNIGQTYNMYYDKSASTNGYTYTGGLVIDGHPLVSSNDNITYLEIVDSGFSVATHSKIESGLYGEFVRTNTGSHYYVAFR